MPTGTLKVYQVRGALDALAARLAASSRFRLDPALIERGRKAARGRDVQAMIDADLAFHDAIYAASGNPLIEQSAHQHWRHLRRVMGAVLQQSRQRDARLGRARGHRPRHRRRRRRARRPPDAKATASRPRENLARQLTGVLTATAPTTHR